VSYTGCHGYPCHCALCEVRADVEDAIWRKQFVLTYWLYIGGCETFHLGTSVTLLISWFIRMGEVVWLGENWGSVNLKAIEIEIEVFCAPLPACLLHCVLKI
jgi:hypothetical protein